MWQRESLSRNSSIPRTTSSATDESERTWPVPPQCGQGFMVLSSTLGAEALARHLQQAEMPEMRPTWMRARSAFR
jgi:hypothetical protein